MREYVVADAQARESSFAFSGLRRKLANWRSRRLLGRLEDADDHLLADMGLTREIVVSAMRLPLDCDPVAELYRRAGRE